MGRLLYIDHPFIDQKGGDKNRSRFLWDQLNRDHHCTVLTTKHPIFKEKFIKNPLIPDGVIQFKTKSLKRFQKYLEQGQFEIVVFRSIAFAQLSTIVERVLPGAKIVVDVDLLLSRLTRQTWWQKPGLKQRYYLKEWFKLSLFEQRYLKKNYLFCYSNPLEMLRGENHIHLPNAAPVVAGGRKRSGEKTILFFGTLNSAANEDGYCFLIQKIFPLIKKLLKTSGYIIRVVGRNRTTLYNNPPEGIEVIGEVDSIYDEIEGASFLLLPLRVGSGTRTRILEGTQLKRAIITTTLGCEGLTFKDGEILIGDTPKKIAAAVKLLIEHPEKRDEIAARGYQRVRGYHPDKIGAQFRDTIEQFKPKKIAIVTNRFYPEVGGAELNIYYQARELSKIFRVDVLVPKRINKPFKEEVDGYSVYRFFDLLNFGKSFPNIRAKTFSPGIFIKLLTGKYDLIHAFPAINYNNMIALLVALLTDTPMIQVFFDFIDYAGVIRETGKINPDILKTVTPTWKQKLFLKLVDHTYAISKREITLLKKYTTSVDYSPVPVLDKEYDRDIDVPEGLKAIRDKSENPFIFLVLGRIAPIKGQDLALDAFLDVADKLPGSYLICVGRSDYNQRFMEEMEQKRDQSDLRERIIFTGSLPRSEVLGWLRYSDIHIIPVRFMNSGAVVVESWFSETPVIQSDAVDPDLVKEGINGFRFPRGRSDLLGKKMEMAYRKRDQLPAMGLAGKNQVSQQYTYRYLIRLYRKKYEQLWQKQG